MKKSGQGREREGEWQRDRQQAGAWQGQGQGQLVMLAAGQAAYKIHKISALKSAAGQKLKT